MNELQETKIIFNNFSWSAVLFLAVLAGCIAVLTYRSLRRGGSMLWSFGLMALRMVAVVALGIAILEPQTVRRSGELMQSRVAVLHDVSGSMAMPAGEDDRTRQEVVRETVEPILESLEGDHDVQYFDFGEQLNESSRGDVTSEKAGRMSQTDVVGAMRSLMEGVDLNALRGVVVISDGRDTVLPADDADERQQIVEQAVEELNVPVFGLHPVDAAELRDVAIANVRASRLGFVRNKWVAKVDLETIGVEEGRLDVMLRRGESIVDVERVRVHPGQSEYTVPLSFRPTRTGRQLLTVEVESPRGETYEENNRTAIVLSVVRDRIRVLQVAGSPSWDVRFLRRTFKTMPIVDLVSFYILRDRQDDPGRKTAHSYLNLIPFPMRELFTSELPNFDVVIFQNFDYSQFFPAPDGFQTYLRNIRDHVQENGGAFVMVGGGQSFEQGHYQGTPIQDVLPVELNGADPVDERTFNARVTSAGNRHPITQFADEKTANESHWDALPELHGCHVLSANKRAEGVLLDNPINDAPIVVPGKAGEGRTLALMTDGTWRWSFEAAGRGLGSEFYAEFWRNALRWLVQDTEDNDLNLSVNRRRLRPGETLRGSVELDEGGDGGKKEVELRAYRKGEKEGEAMERVLTTDDDGRADFNFEIPTSGGWTVEARAGRQDESGNDDSAPVTTTSIVAEPGGQERRELRPDRELLEHMAQASGGEVYDLTGGDAPDNLPTNTEPIEQLSLRDVQSLWDNWVMFGVIVVCLSVEWWLRRRRGVT